MSGGGNPWSLVSTAQDLAGIWRIDPYLAWAQESQWVGFGQPTSTTLVRALLEVSANLSGSDPLKTWLRERIEANPLNVDPERAQSPFVTISLELQELVKLTEAVHANLLSRFQLGLARGGAPDAQSGEPFIDHGPFIGAFQAAWSLHDGGDAPQAVVRTLGVIDDGCCLAHEGLRPDNHTIFLLVWDQNPRPMPPAPPTTYPWQRFAGISYGEELTYTVIDDLLQDHDPKGEEPELAFYANVLSRSEWGQPERSHGAGVLHTLANTEGRTSDETPLMIFVQLPGDTVADTSGGSLGVYLLDGVRYIVQRTQLIARLLSDLEIPIPDIGQNIKFSWDWNTAINVSLGSIAGPHDGTSITEQALAALGLESRIDIVLAAGNTAGRNIHASRLVTMGQPGAFHLMVPPDNPRESYVEFWLPTNDHTVFADNFEIEVVSPDGSTSPKVPVGKAALLSDQGVVQAALIYPRSVAQGLHGTMVLLAIRSTRQAEPASLGTAPVGYWTMHITCNLQASVKVHAWVERNDIIIGGRRPQQACFVDDGSGYVSDDSTLSSVANGTDVIVVGGFCRNGAQQSTYSANGPVLRATYRQDPEYLAPADDSESLPGVQVPGFFSGTHRRMSGTSVAAPCVTRWIARNKDAKQERHVWTLDSRTTRGVEQEDGPPAGQLP